MHIRILALRFVLGIVVLNGLFSSCQISFDETMVIEEYSETKNLDNSALFIIEEGLVVFNSIDIFRALAEDNLKQDQLKNLIKISIGSCIFQPMIILNQKAIISRLEFILNFLIIYFHFTCQAPVEQTQMLDFHHLHLKHLISQDLDQIARIAV